jgi:hypothetical protein
LNIDAFLKRLDDEQALLAKAALSQPQSRDAFEYGRVVGMYSGLERVKAILMDTLKDIDQRNNNL